MAVSGGANPVFSPGSIVPFAVSAAVTAGRFVEVSGQKTVAPASAGSRKVVGVALQTADAVGDVIPVHLLGYIFTLPAEGAVSAGDELITATGVGNEGHVSALAAAGGATAADINNARAVVGVALQDIVDEASGWVLVRV